MDLFKLPKTYKIAAGAVALSMVAAPVIVQADSSNPVYVPKKKMKAQVKPRAKAKPVMRKPAPKPMVQEPVYSPPPPPVYTPPPAPVYTPPPPPPPPAPAPVAAAPVAKAGGNGLLVGLLGAAAVVGGILLVSGDDKPSSP